MIIDYSRAKCHCFYFQHRKQNIFLLFMFQFQWFPPPMYVRLRDCYGHQVICTITKPLPGHGADLHSVQYTGYLNESERLCLEPRGKNTAQLPSHFPLQLRNI